MKIGILKNYLKTDFFKYIYILTPIEDRLRGWLFGLHVQGGHAWPCRNGAHLQMLSLSFLRPNILLNFLFLISRYFSLLCQHMVYRNSSPRLDSRMPTFVMKLTMQRTINIQTCLPKAATTKIANPSIIFSTSNTLEMDEW